MSDEFTTAVADKWISLDPAVGRSLADKHHNSTLKNAGIAEAFFEGSPVYITMGRYSEGIMTDCRIYENSKLKIEVKMSMAARALAKQSPARTSSGAEHKRSRKSVCSRVLSEQGKEKVAEESRSKVEGCISSSAAMVGSELSSWGDLNSSTQGFSNS